jgi:hypothetical protein
MRTLLALALTACGGTSPQPAAPAPSNQLDVAPRTTQAPEVRWDAAMHQLVNPGLPAVARGGELVVLPVVESDGGRGNSNLRLEVRDRTDKLAQKIALWTADEFDKLGDDARDRRIQAANRELAQLHGLHDLTAMHGLEIEPPADNKLKHLAIGDGLDVDFAGDHLHVFRHNANQPFITLDTRGWLAKADKCDHPAFVKAVYHANEINVLVVDIAYMGTDTCWEPSDQLHVIAW